ncbi:MAG: hypothetical protein V1734_04265 [Nanoarchaeota archaeon]
MTEIHLNLNNFLDSGLLLSIFPESSLYEFTSKKVFRLKGHKVCACSHEMVHNGYDYARKKGLGKVRIGKQRCTICNNEHHEDKSFWKGLLSRWKETITKMILTLRDSHVSWQAIANLMKFILPCGKDKAIYLFNEAVEEFRYTQENYAIVHYDEQHPKQGRNQRFRLTLLNYKTKKPIGDELFDNKDEATIEAFLRKYLDAEKEIVIITDCDRRYPSIFKRIWGNKVIHQKCLLHLNKLVVYDFGRNLSLLNMFNLYLLLNIFYNREKELKFLKNLLKKEDKKSFASAKEKREWVKWAKQKFREYLRNMENTRRGNGENLTQRKLFKAENILADLLNQKGLFPRKARKRLDMIRENWKYFTAFYHIKDCPATNNLIENFYSTSLKTHRKKQLRSEKGIVNHMKLAAIKRSTEMLAPKETILEVYSAIMAVVS